MVYTLFSVDPLAVTAPTSAQATLVKEDVTDLIANLYPLDTPLLQYLGRVPMHRESIESPVDTFSGITRTSAAVAMSTAAAGTDTVVRVEDHTPTDLTATYQHKLRAVAEIHVESFSASGTARQASFHGITDPYLYEAYKAGEKVVNDFEFRFWHGRGTTPGGGNVDNFATGAITDHGLTDGTNAPYPRQTQGVFNWIVRSGLERTVSGTGATMYNAHGELLKSTAIGNYQSYAYDLNGQNLTRDNFRYKLMQAWWAIGGRPDGCVMFMGGRPKGMFSDFAMSVNGQVNTRNIPAENRTLIDTVDVYKTDYGTHWVNLSRYLDLEQSSIYNTTSAGSDVTVAWNESIIAMMPQYWKIGVFRGVGYTPLAKTSDGDRGMIVGEMGIICRNPIAGAALVNCVAGT